MLSKSLIAIFTLSCFFIPISALSDEPPMQAIEVKPQAEVPEEAKAKEGPALVEVRPGHVTVNFKEADIRTVLSYFSEVSGVDIVPAPNVTGQVTLKLTDKPWEIALDVIVRNYGYAIEREQDIIRVVTLDSLKKQELATEVVELSYGRAETIQESVKDMLSERGKSTYDSRTNILLVTDIPANIHKIKAVVEKLDKQTPQIMIEAKIIETTLEKDEKMGIDWNIKIAAIGAKRPTTVPFNSFLSDWGFHSGVIPAYVPSGLTSTSTVTVGSGGATQSTGTSAFPATGTEGSKSFPFIDSATAYNVFTYGTLDFSQFSAILELLKQRRDTEIVSNPRITTLDNQEAKIVVGRVYNFPTFSQVEETGRWVISGYEPKELGIKLMVTPHVNEKGEISVELKPEISNYLGLEKISEELSAPLWSTREAQTQVMVKDGDTVFIGGLVTENEVEGDKRIPIIGDLLGGIPFIGQLVKSKTLDKEKTELVFFITVHIVKDIRALNQSVITESSRNVIVKKDFDKDIDLGTPKEEKPAFLDFRKKKQDPAAKNSR